MNVYAQESPATPLSLRSNGAPSIRTPGRRNAVKTAANAFRGRKLVKIKTRAGDTLGLLGDRFGALAEEIAVLNGIAVTAPLPHGSELMIPLPSSRLPAEKIAQHSSGDSPDVNRGPSSDPEAAWENVQGVLFRRPTPASSSEQATTDFSVGRGTESDAGTSRSGPLGKVIEASEAERSAVAQPVWIYLIGGARVEADSVNETPEGAWYKRGNLTVFLERARIERIERERAAEIIKDATKWTERRWSTGNAKFDALIRANGARFGVDPYLIFCVMEQESQFRPRVVSPKGARGLMQLMPGTAAHLGVRRPFDPAENIMGGTKYLKQLLANFNGRVDLVLAGYNAGEGAVMKFGRRVPPYKETRNYVKRISQRYGQGRTLIAPPIAAKN